MTNQKSTLDLSRFVSIGDSITAGYADGALFYEGQQNTYPNLIAKQISLTKPIDFTQPLLDKNSAGIGFYGRSRLTLKKNPIGKTFDLSYISSETNTTLLSQNIYKAHAPFSNMAVPGAKLIHLLFPGYGNSKAGNGNYNPFFSRMASNTEQASILSDILKLEPTFFTFYLGNNDALTFAKSGGTIDQLTPLKGIPGEGFDETLRLILNKLTVNGAKGILATIPNITIIPFFNTIPPNSLVLNDAQARKLNNTYLNEKITFNKGYNAYVLEDFIEGNKVIRQIKKDELILSDIILDPLKNDYLNGTIPLPKHFTLTSSQIDVVKEAIRQYNSSIELLAKEKKLGLVNLNKLLKNLKSDRYYDSNKINIIYNQNGVFSLDGIHINSLGQALLANEFLKVIHKKFGLKIQRVPIFRFRKKQNVTHTKKQS